MSKNISLENLVEKAATNISQKTTYKFPNSDLKFTLKYRPYASGYQEQYLGRTYSVFSDSELIGDIYDDMDGTFTMWVDDLAIIVKGLTEIKHIEQAWQDGKLN